MEGCRGWFDPDWRSCTLDIEFIFQPAGTTALGEHLLRNLEGTWSQFRAAVAFVKRSGTRHLLRPLERFASHGHTEIAVGIDHGGTSVEGLQDLLNATAPTGRVTLFHNRLPFTFHPKVFLFKSPTKAELFLGSGNLTEGGLFTNYEASVRIRLNLSVARDTASLLAVEQALDDWTATGKGTTLQLDQNILDQLAAEGVIPTERSMRSQDSVLGHASDDSSTALEYFAAHPESVNRRPKAAAYLQPLSTPPIEALRHFVMILQKTDVGQGQTTAGTARRSPEIFIPLVARDAHPDFWQWPDQFTEDTRRPGKLDRRDVPMHLGGRRILVNMMTWPDKHDFRLRNASLRDAGSIGDILYMERISTPGSALEYLVEIVPKESGRYSLLLKRCNSLVRNSRKRFGYY